MSLSVQPFVSILIVNYNGRSVLAKCLASLEHITYPKKLYEIIVVDNDSMDGSVAMIRKDFPDVRVIPSGENLGFTGGNNLAYSYSSGEYIVLLNTDTTVDPHWLDSLVETAQRDEKIGVVNSKLYFTTPFVDITIRSTQVSRADLEGSADFSPLGVLMEDITCSNSPSYLVWYDYGFSGRVKTDVIMRWTTGEAHVLVPFNLECEENEYVFTMYGYPYPNQRPCEFSLSMGKEVILSDSLKSQCVQQYRVKMDRKKVENRLTWLVQNAGNILLSDGYGKDRGSVVRRRDGISQEFYERDSDYFRKERELLVFCGASCLIKREAIRETGFFDDLYYMYYEDVDLSLRLWKAGWKIIYDPDSVVYHVHHASTGPSPADHMLYHIEKNHIAILLTYFPISSCVIQFLLFCMRTVLTYVLMNAYMFRDNLPKYEKWHFKYESRKRAFFFLLWNIPSLIKKRNLIERQSIFSREKMVQHLY